MSTIIHKITDRLRRRQADSRRQFADTARAIAVGAADKLDLDKIEETLSALGRAPEDLEVAAELLERRRELLDTVADHDPALEDLRRAQREQQRLGEERDELLRKLRERAETVDDAVRSANNRHQAALNARLRLRDCERQLREVLGEREAQHELDTAERAQAAAVAVVANIETDLAAARRALDDVRHNHKVAPGPDVDRVLLQTESRVADIEARLAKAVEQREQADARLTETHRTAALV